LGNLIGADGGAEEASKANIRCAWAKFSGSSAKIKGSFSESERKSILSVLGYATEN